MSEASRLFEPLEIEDDERFQQIANFWHVLSCPDFSTTFTAMELEYMIKDTDADHSVDKAYASPQNVARLRALEETCPYLNVLCKIIAEAHQYEILDEDNVCSGERRQVKGPVIGTPLCFSFEKPNTGIDAKVVPVLISISEIHTDDGEVVTAEVSTPLRGSVVEYHFPDLN